MILKTLPVFLATIASGALAFAAQEGHSTPASNEPPIHIYRADKLKDVEIKGGGDQVQGRLDSLIIDSNTGQIAYAIVAQGGMLGLGEHNRLVPLPALYFAAKLDKNKKETDECEISSALTKEQLSGCPAFKHGLSLVADLERKAFESCKLPQNQNIGRGAPERLLCSSDIEGCSVRGEMNDVLGKIERVLVDPQQAIVAYLVLDTGEKHVALPWQSCTPVFDKDQVLSLATKLASSRMETAPTYVEKDWKRMTSRQWLLDLAAYHDVEPYWVRSTAVTASVPVEQKH